MDPSCAFPSEALDGSWVGFWRSAAGYPDYQDEQPVEVVYDKVSMEHELLRLSPLLPDKDKEWTEVSMAGSLLGPDCLPSLSSPMTAQDPIDSLFHQAHDPCQCIEGFHSDGYDYRHDHHYQPTTPSPLQQCVTHFEAQDDYCYQSHSLSGQSQFPIPLEVAAADLDMMMSLEINNQNYCGYDKDTGDMSSRVWKYVMIY